MVLTVPRSGIPGGVISVHEPPSSRVTQMRPSSVPAHISPGAWDDSSKAKMVLKTSTPVLSRVMPAAPEYPWVSGSLYVRSGLMTSQLWPSSVVRCTYCEAW